MELFVIEDITGRLLTDTKLGAVGSDPEAHGEKRCRRGERRGSYLPRRQEVHFAEVCHLRNQITVCDDDVSVQIGVDPEWKAGQRHTIRFGHGSQVEDHQGFFVLTEQRSLTGRGADTANNLPSSHVKRKL